MRPRPQEEFEQVQGWIMQGDELNLRRAAKALKSPTKFPPDHPLTLSLKGLLYMHRGQYEQAAKAFHKAVELSNWRHPPSIVNLAVALQRLGRIADAAEVWDAAIAKVPDQSYFHIGKATNLAAAQSYEEAIAQLEIASGLIGKLPHQGLLQDGTPLAMPHVQTAIMLFLKGMLTYLIGDLETAVELLREAAGRYLMRAQPVPLTKASSEFIRTGGEFIIDFDREHALSDFLLCLHQMDDGSDQVEEIFPLFTLDTWLPDVSPKYQGECREAISEAVGQARDSGDWRPAVRLAENWYESMLLQNNPEFMKRVGPLLGSDAPPDVSKAISHQDFIALLRGNPS